MAQSLQGQKKVNFADVDKLRRETISDFKNSIRAYTNDQRVKLAEQTIEPWKLQALSEDRNDTVQAVALSSEFIYWKVLRNKLLDENISRIVIYYGAMNPLLFSPTCSEFFLPTVNYLSTHIEYDGQHNPVYDGQLGLAKNRAASPEVLAELTKPTFKSPQTKFLETRSLEVRLEAIKHPNTPIEIKLEYARNNFSGYEIQAQREAAIEGIMANIAIVPRS
ncbi:MAG: hypothetical protein KGH61_02120 [Candidatus Micrarchaeota archaeon]|nr:hypothetical protein [Candidatus Micrarchaeota archaeon]MDE1847726.1 hypothetical protein [Candidatus Micrarchaeota archaeon]MDE1864155.1 hypothetical protein [Candidatus Micrarchaeota archaeon]